MAHAMAMGSLAPLHSGVEPLQGVLFREDSPVSFPTVLLFLLLCMDTVELGGIIISGRERTEVYVLWARVCQGGDLDLSEEVDSVRRHGDADRGEVFGGESREILVTKMLLLKG